MIKKLIKDAIEKVVKEEKFPKTDVEVNETAEESFGDYSTNIAMKLSSLGVKQSPVGIAKKFVPKLNNTLPLNKIEIAGPGFINFNLEPKLIQNSIQKIIEEDKDFGTTKINKSKKARVEFISANPTGPLHIGNARGGPIGDSLAKVLESTGYKITREYYDNNVGSQVEIFVNNLKKIIEGEEDKEGQYTGTYYKEIVQKLKNSKDLESTVTREIFEEIISDAKDMGIVFEEIQHESELQESGNTKNIIDHLKSEGFTKEKEGALWFVPGGGLETAKFLEDRDSVIVRSNGKFTYFADDIAYHKKKFDSGADLIVNILGSNHHGHIPRLYAAIKALGFDSSKYKVVLYQYVRVKRGKDIVRMSKREGNYVTAREVLDEVGKDAFRFFLLSHSPGTHMDFDLEQAKQKNESNPVHYVQYAHARASNILKNSHEKFSSPDLSLLSQPQELKLMKKLIKLPELVEDISENLTAHQLTTYSIEVADLFHKYYERYRVIGEEKELMKARLNLVLATKIVLRNTLNLLGVSAPERM